jgi:thiol-disulfide isomerase/thioredoxin
MDNPDTVRLLQRIPGIPALTVLLIVAYFGAATVASPAQMLPPASSVIEHEGIVVPLYESFEALAPLFDRKSDTTMIVNFWATWCAPCVEELPYFEELTRERGERKYRIILVSLDFRKQLLRRLMPFLKAREMTSTVVVLDDADANAWIDRVDESWSGAIPATLVFNAARREFHEQSFTREELHSIVDSFTGDGQ